jgi:hypothetical protein
MGRRGSNSFKRNDGLRALKIARDGGLEPAGLEIVVGADGTTTFRVLGDKLAPETPGSAGAKAWHDQLEKLKKTRPKEP